MEIVLLVLFMIVCFIRGMFGKVISRRGMERRGRRGRRGRGKRRRIVIGMVIIEK